MKPLPLTSYQRQVAESWKYGSTVFFFVDLEDGYYAVMRAREIIGVFPANTPIGELELPAPPPPPVRGPQIDLSLNLDIKL